MDDLDIVRFVRQNVEPVQVYGGEPQSYRIAGTMTDGTILPCILVKDVNAYVELAMRRFQETRQSEHVYMGYANIVRNFIANGNRVWAEVLRDLSLSAFAIPLARMREVKGETSMGWTEFYATMNDGSEFRFGTTFLTEFFDMPQGYVASDIAKIVPAERGAPPHVERIYRERPYFTCYVNGL